MIELMIVVTIISLLAALSLPSYHQYIRRARFTEVILATQPYKMHVALALQAGFEAASLDSGKHGIPQAAKPTDNLAALYVENGVIFATASTQAGGDTYTLSPNADGTRWRTGGSCLNHGICTA